MRSIVANDLVKRVKSKMRIRHLFSLKRSMADHLNVAVCKYSSIECHDLLPNSAVFFFV